MFVIPSSKYLGHFASRFFGAGYGHPQADSFDYGPTGPSSGFPFILNHTREELYRSWRSLRQTTSQTRGPWGKKVIKKNVNDRTKISMMILNMVSLLQNGGDYKDFYKSGKKEDFASYDEYWNVSQVCKYVLFHINTSWKAEVAQSSKHPTHYILRLSLRTWSIKYELSMSM